MALYFLCVHLSKNIRKCLLFITIHIFSTHFPIILFYFHILKMQTNYGTAIYQKEWTKSKQEQSHVTFTLTRRSIFDLPHKQCNCFIKGWLHCLTSESKGRFLVNNILLAWCLVVFLDDFSLNCARCFGWFCLLKRLDILLGVTETLPQTLVTKTVLYITKVVIRSAYCINWATSNVKVFWTLYPYHGEWRRLPVILSYSNMNCKKNIENTFPRMFFHTADINARI